MSRSAHAALLLDVLAQDRDRGPAHGAGEIGPGPQLLGPPVVPSQVIRELLSQPPSRETAMVGEKFTSRWT